MLAQSQGTIGDPSGGVPQLDFYNLLYSQNIGGAEVRIFVERFWQWWVPFAFIISIFLMIAVVYLVIRLNQIREEQQSFLRNLSLEAGKGAGQVVNERWARIIKLSESSSENDWRQAIMEADIVLDNMMTAMGYTQDTLGEKLKSVEKSDFTTIDHAWEAHKVRNAVAHEGSDLDISHREVRRVIELYKSVFEEFHYI